MKIIHSIGQEKIAKNVQEDVGFLLANKQGSYISLFSQPTSRYQGWFVPFGDKLYKIIEDLKPVNVPMVGEIRNNFWNIDRRRDYIYESFVLPDYYNCLIYELSESAEVEVTLDIRESDDLGLAGQYYEITEEKGIVLIKYSQPSSQEFYLAIKTDKLNYQKIDQWVKRNYQLDKDRNSLPFQKDVYLPLRLTGRKFVFSIAQDKQKAIKEARLVFERTVILKQLEMEKVKKLPLLKNIKDQEVKMAYLCAQNSLSSLTVIQQKKIGIYAGLPWSFQLWARDEAISLKALAGFLGEEAKEILWRLMVSIGPDGRILPIPSPNADGVGWVFKRAEDLVLKKEFNDSQKEKIKMFLEKSIDGLLQHHTQDNLAVNKARETWMDTLDRSGARIEIQALRLNMYRLAYQLTKDTKYFKLERKLRKAVQQKFFNGQILADGDNDFVARPNVFIAAYIYPHLLKKKQWRHCFENILVKLWLEWGGLATVDKDNSMFCDQHTGQEPKSHHCGDAWFAINNLAALVLYKVGKKKFSYQINKIFEASTQEILWQGVIGHQAELSSASQLKSAGNWAQAQGAAMYLEFVNTILKLKK